MRKRKFGKGKRKIGKVKLSASVKNMISYIENLKISIPKLFKLIKKKKISKVAGYKKKSIFKNLLHFYILTNYHKDKLRKTIYLQTLHKYKIPKNISNQRGEKTCTWKPMILMKETEDTNKCKDTRCSWIKRILR